MVRLLTLDSVRPWHIASLKRELMNATDVAGGAEPREAVIVTDNAVVTVVPRCDLVIETARAVDGKDEKVKEVDIEGVLPQRGAKRTQAMATQNDKCRFPTEVHIGRLRHVLQAWAG